MLFEVASSPKKVLTISPNNASARIGQIEIQFPDIGDDEVEVTEIMVKVGDAVFAEQSLLTVESDKASMELPVPFDGVVKEISVQTGSKVKTGSRIMVFEVVGRAMASAPADLGKAPEAAPLSEQAASTMSTPIKVPVLPKSVADATIAEWHVKPGDKVECDQVLVDIETDKVVLEVVAPSSGILTDVSALEGQTVLAEQIIAQIIAASETAPADEQAAITELKEVTVPDIGCDEVEVTEILVKVGDKVAAGQTLICVEGIDHKDWTLSMLVAAEHSLLSDDGGNTAKAVLASFAGVVKDIRVQTGSKVKTGSIIMLFDVAGFSEDILTPALANIEDTIQIEAKISMPKTNIDKQNKSELNKAVDRLVTRSNKSYEEKINHVASEYLDVLDSLTPEKLSEKTGISSSAFIAVENLPYKPGFEFPELLRLGALEFKNDAALSPSVIPWLHDFSVRRSLVINGFDSDTTQAMMQNIAFRILASIEPQLVHCHFIDPTGLGQYFSHLSQLSDVLKGTKILTETNEIERVLAEAKAAAVNLVQEKLTHKYSSLKEYNAVAGSKLAEPYRCIFIANFPCGFNQKAIEMLFSLISTAGKSGISVFISLNEAELSNYRNLADFPNSELPLSVISPNTILYAADSELLNTCFNFFPEREVTPNAGALIDAINAKAMLAQSKTVDIDDLCTSKANKTSSAANVTIPVGLVGKENPCLLTLGSSKSGHHVLIGGATGSGKTVLLHNIIINGARTYEPDELVFYLLDYKEGTEFKCYEHLPHVRILSMESNRAFGLSVLQNLQEEIEKRGKLFKAAGVATLKDFKETTGQFMPRLLVIIDEFQVLLKERDRLSNNAAEILDDISRRGRSFGVHMILSTQTLSDVELKSSTMSNIAVRIGLRMSESDSIRLFHRDNTVAATLKKAGEAYFNAAHGQSEGNIRFQVAWLDMNKIEEIVAEIRFQFSERPEVYQHRYIMNGQTYAQFQANRLEKFSQQNQQHANHLYTDLLMAEPSFISQDAVSLRLRRQFSSNILAVGDAPADVTALSLLLLSQLVQFSAPGSHFYIVDLFAVDTPWHGKLHMLTQRYPKQVTSLRANQLSNLLDELDTSLIQRAAGDEPTTDRKVLWLLNAQAARIFDSSAGMVGGGSPATKKLEKILKEGADSAIHVFLHCSQYQGLSKLFSSTGILKDFENCIALRGGDSQKLLPPGSQPIKSEGVAYVLSPRTRYEADPCRLYDPQQVFEHFHAIPEGEV